MPANPAESIRQAVELARAGNPAKGLEILLSEQGEGSTSGSPYSALHHYTLGNLYLELGRPGEALAHLDHARRLAGRTGAVPGLEESLTSARSQVEARAGSALLDRASTGLEKIVQSPLFVPAEALMAILALSTAIRLWRNPRRPGGSRSQIWGALIAWSLALVLGASHGCGLRRAAGRVAQAASVRSGPSEDFAVLGLAPAGAEIRLIEERVGQRGSWSRIQVSPELSGWVESARLLLFEGPSTTALGR